MKDTTYRCDLCHRPLWPETPSGRIREGWPLTWTGPGMAIPEPGARLETARGWAASAKHLCQICVRAVHEFFLAADNAGEIQPEQENP